MNGVFFDKSDGMDYARNIILFDKSYPLVPNRCPRATRFVTPVVVRPVVSEYSHSWKWMVLNIL